MILIYSKKESKRLRYILDFLFIDILKINYTLTHSAGETESHVGPCICYHSEKKGKGIHISDSGFLYEDTVRKFHPEISVQSDSFELFPATSGDISFDLFAASFYLLSRYEEYIAFRPDKHGRFPAESSMAYRYNFLHRPLIDEWALQLRQVITEHYPDFNFPEKEATFLSTFDIDQAYYLKHKSFARVLNSFLRSLIQRDWKEFGNKIKILAGKLPDPYDTLDKAETLHHRYGIKALYFFLMAEKYTSKDINIHIENKAFTRMIQRLSENSLIGIHPSYSSYLNVSTIRKERRTLELICNTPITKSRQHFLRMTLPKSYQAIIRSGIREDYTMGYASQTGFRASTCTPFNFYNLSNECVQDLRIYPFCVMDASFTSYLHKNPSEAIQEIERLIFAVKAVQGSFISLWHNESLSGYKYWEGWAPVYEKMLSLFFKDHSDDTHNLKK